MGRLLVLFIVVPAVELAILVEIGSRIGILPTLGIIILTGTIGASLARWQGLQVLRKVQAELAAGRLPAGTLADGLIILIAGALLITPGILTDAAGFLLLVPAYRGFMKRAIWRRFEEAVRQQKVHVYVDADFTSGAPSEGRSPGEPRRDAGRLTGGSPPEDGES